MKQTTRTPEFVEYIPEIVQEGIIYISTRFATAVHKCACGCGSEVVTPLSPREWTLIFDGETVSLDPSIGNWSFSCQSHYWIRHNRIVWARRWSKSEIQAARAEEGTECEEHSSATTSRSTSPEKLPILRQKGLWDKIRNWRNSKIE